MHKKIAIGLTALAIAAAGLGARAAMAYYSDSEETVNTFTVGDVVIEMLEPDYPGNTSDDVKDLVPNQEVPKNPMVTNTGINDAVVFMVLDSPMEYISIVNDDTGAITTPRSVTELFWFKDRADLAKTHENKFDSGWERLTGKEMYVKIAANGKETLVDGSTQALLKAAYDSLGTNERLVKRYVFGYKQPVQGSSVHDGTAPTAANKSTTNLFDKIQVKNFIEGEVDDKSKGILMHAYAIQDAEIYENKIDLTETLSAANLGKIYDIFIAQNQGDNDKLNVSNQRDGDSKESNSDGASGTTDSHVDRYGN